MSEEVVLTPRALDDANGAAPVEAECIAADRFAALSEREIAELPVWLGRRAARLGDLFDVRGGRAARARVAGDAARVDGIGTAMAGGEVIVEGSAGRMVGARMTGGRVVVRGDAGDGAGCAMAGGALRVDGRAGDGLGGAAPGASKGMSGGEIVVCGTAGAGAGARARRGLVAVGGAAGAGAGEAMIAGTVVVLGAAGAGAARWSKRGTLVAMGPVEVPPTFRYACTYAPPHLRLTLTYLRARYGLPITPAMVGGRYRRYSGDMAELGRGEILRWAPE